MNWLLFVVGWYLFITAIAIYFMNKTDQKNFSQRGEYYKLNNWQLQSQMQSGHSHFGLGFLALPFLPFLAIPCLFSKVKYAIVNARYYLPNGHQKRIDYIKQIVAERYKKINEHQVFLRKDLGSPDYLHDSIINGKTRDWSLRKIFEQNLYEEFAEDFLPSRFLFWGRATLCLTAILLWPVTMVLIAIIPAVFLLALGFMFVLYLFGFRNFKRA